jgi:hypothetical protein
MQQPASLLAQRIKRKDQVLGVLFLGEVYSAFLPSKKACWAHQFRYLGVGQQYPGVNVPTVVRPAALYRLRCLLR